MTNEQKEMLSTQLSKANTFHNEFETACNLAKENCFFAIECARQCGQALLECKKLKPHGTWKLWLEKNFTCKSYETAVNYMRIAEEWDEDYIKFGIHNGTIRLSLNSILQAIKQKKREPNGGEYLGYLSEEEIIKRQKEVGYKNYLRQDIRKYFTSKLQNLEFELENNIDDTNMSIEGLYILREDFKGLFSFELWDSFKNNIFDTIKKQINDGNFKERIKSDFEFWEKVDKTERARAITPECIESVPGDIVVNDAVLESVNAEINTFQEKVKEKIKKVKQHK